MLPFGRIMLAAAASVVLAPAVARAADPAYTAVVTQSSLTYAFTQAGAENQGRFKSFTVSFDPAANRLDVVVDMRSYDTGDQQRNDTLGGKDFFDVAQYPQSRFSASRIAKTATGYEATGSLTLRGVTRNVTIPFTWRTAAMQGHSVGYLSGQMTLKRLDFSVGQGQWQSTDWVDNDVTVRFSLTLTTGQ
jgi:polyisoprenoid-binding protein YceI